jgi:hypothetical protein
VPGPLYGSGNFTLMAGTVAGDPTGYNFTSFGNEMTQRINVFVINDKFIIDTKAANFPTMKYRAAFSFWDDGHSLFLRRFHRFRDRDDLFGRGSGFNYGLGAGFLDCRFGSRRSFHRGLGLGRDFRLQGFHIDIFSGFDGKEANDAVVNLEVPLEFRQPGRRSGKICQNVITLAEFSIL